MLKRLFQNLAALLSAPRATKDQLPFTEVWQALRENGLISTRPEAFIAITPHVRWNVIRNPGDWDFLCMPDDGDPRKPKVDFSGLYKQGKVSWRYPVKLPYDNMGFMGPLSGRSGKIILKSAQQRSITTEMMS